MQFCILHSYSDHYIVGDADITAVHAPESALYSAETALVNTCVWKYAQL